MAAQCVLAAIGTNTHDEINDEMVRAWVGAMLGGDAFEDLRKIRTMLQQALTKTK